MKPTASLICSIIGYNIGWLAVAIGSHGGEAWPTLLFCGPVWPIATAFGDNMAYVWTIIYGTAILYAVYGWCLCHFRWWKAMLTIVLLHTPFALLSFAF